MACARALLAAWLMAAGFAAQAANIPGYPDSVQEYDPRDIALLPRYCKSTDLFRYEFHTDPAEVEHWKAVMGPGFAAMHHYCWAMMETNRAMLLARTKQIRDFYLSSALNNIDYVLRNSPPDFVMLPEILTKKGENLLRLNRSVQGVEALQQAIVKKADYWPPYAALSDHFRKAGNIAQARAWLEKGLSAAPRTAALEKRLKELDGGVRQKPEG